MEIIHDKQGIAVIVKAVWCIEDVLQRAEENEIELTREEAGEVLGLTYKYHDCNIGISWETLDVWIDEVVNERINK